MKPYRLLEKFGTSFTPKSSAMSGRTLDDQQTSIDVFGFVFANFVRASPTQSLSSLPLVQHWSNTPSMYGRRTHLPHQLVLTGMPSATASGVTVSTASLSLLFFVGGSAMMKPTAMLVLGPKT